MKIAFFDTHGFERAVFQKENEKFNHEIVFFETRLTEQTVNFAAGYECVCAFVNNCLDEKLRFYKKLVGTEIDIRFSTVESKGD